MDKKKKTRFIQIGLFILTVVTTTLAGAEWSKNQSILLGTMSWDGFVTGFAFSIPFLGILTVHEFGHYFVAKYHKINISLPYYIPMWFGFIGAPSIGTMGAFIRIREHIDSRMKYFDVGVSGPIAGFVVAIFVLWYGFANLPEKDFIYEIHPEYRAYNSVEEAVKLNGGVSIRLGGSLLFNFFRDNVADPEKLPHPNELMHYPWLLAGYLALFFTAFNLLPIGQLDGGHVLLGLFGAQHHGVISKLFFSIFLFYAGLGWLTTADLTDMSLVGIGGFMVHLATYLLLVYLCSYSIFNKDKSKRLLYATIMLTVQFLIASIFKVEGYPGWLLFALIIGRFIGVDHPRIVDNAPLNSERKILGWVALIIFVLCFSPQPLVLEEGMPIVDSNIP